MRPYRDVLGWLAAVLLTGCVAPQTGGPTALRPATDRLLSRGDVQVAQAHLQDFGFDPGPVDGSYTAQTPAAVRATRSAMASRSRDCWTMQPACGCSQDWTSNTGGGSDIWMAR
jgi:Putative peptidoglycan binding domain